MPVQTKEELINTLREAKPILMANYGLKSIGIFGSFSRNENNLESDVDLLVDISEAKFDYLAGMQNYLEMKLGRSVDLVRLRPNLRKSFIDKIQREIINV